MSKHEEDDNEPVMVRGRIMVPLACFLGALASAALGTWRICSVVDGLHYEMQEGNRYMRQLGKDCLTVPRFNTWIDDAKDANPAVKFPRLQAIVEPAGSLPPEPK